MIPGHFQEHLDCLVRPPGKISEESQEIYMEIICMSTQHLILLNLVNSDELVTLLTAGGEDEEKPM